MSQRLLVFVLMTFVAFAAGGCASKSRRSFEEMDMPLQTGSFLHRHVQVPTGPKEKTKTKKKEKENAKTTKPEAEPSATPKPEEESTPSPDRFR